MCVDNCRPRYYIFVRFYTVHLGLVSVAETSSKVWGGRDRRKIFLLSPPNYEIWRGRQGTHCLLELPVNVGSVASVWLLYMVTQAYLNLFCQIHTADATQLSSWVASASAVCRAYWALANCMGIAVQLHILWVLVWFLFMQSDGKLLLIELIDWLKNQ